MSIQENVPDVFFVKVGGKGLLEGIDLGAFRLRAPDLAVKLQLGFLEGIFFAGTLANKKLLSVRRVLPAHIHNEGTIFL